MIARNVVSGNNSSGVRIIGSSEGNLIQGNYIGTDGGGSAALGNSSDGVNGALSVGLGGNVIGGTNAGAANVIAFNSNHGVSVSSGTNNPIRANPIFGNISMGIDLNNEYNVQANDPGDLDSGANQLQNFPVLAAGSTIKPANTMILGSLNSQPNTAYQLDFFASVFPDPAYPNGEGQQYRVREVLGLVELEGVEEMMPSDLSGGMGKRVALARAIAIAPAGLLYDEPTTGLDPITANAINALIRTLQGRIGVTSIVVTHDIQSAFSVADRLAFLHEGRILFHGTVAQARTTTEPLLREFLSGGVHGD